MSIMVDLRFRYTEGEYVSATRAYMLRSTRLMSGFCLSLFLLLIGLSGFTAGFDSSFSYLLVGISLVFILIFLMAFFVMPRKQFRSDPRFRDEYSLQFSEDSIHFKSAHLESTLQWSLYTKFTESRRFYILVYGENMITVIPKRVFAGAGQEAMFRELLRRKIAPGANSGRLKEQTTGELEQEYAPPSEMPDWR